MSADARYDAGMDTPSGTPSRDVEVIEADLGDPAQAGAVAALIDDYARGSMGGGRPLPDTVRERLPSVLTEAQAVGTVAFLAFEATASGDRASGGLATSAMRDPATAVGVAVCHRGLSTFHARTRLNIHDVFVAESCRNRGVAGALLDTVEAWAVRQGCCALSLEVRIDNAPARRAYERHGFTPCDPPMDFWVKPLPHDTP